MNEIHPEELVPGDEHPIADAIRKAIGASTYESVSVLTPQFERPDGKTFTFRPDKSTEFFGRLAQAPEETLRDIGMQRWDEHLLLFPCEWYDHIPEGYPVYTINEECKPFQHGETNDDMRHGVLAYGFKKGVA